MRHAVLLSIALLCACGQSGDLYLPAEPPPGQAEPPAAAPDEKKDEP